MSGPIIQIALSSIIALLTYVYFSATFKKKLAKSERGIDGAAILAYVIAPIVPAAIVWVIAFFALGTVV